MSLSSSRRTSGFTLVEMTIVLGIAGILFGGLWKMLSAGNAQMRDQATANQQLQLVSAVSNYLQSSGDDLSSLTGGGQKFLKNLPANGGIAPLELPDGGANCSGTAAKGFCAFLPAGFTSVTKNPYGQTYLIRVKRDNTNLNEIPKTYSFMILTTGGKAIPDASGGRISAAMGGDGGFVYSSEVCNADFSAYACGAYGAWIAKPVGDYNFPVSESGHVASRSYPSSQSLGSGDVWLARNLLSSDHDYRIYNTMTTALFLGESPIYFGKYNVADASAPKTMYVQDGTIDLGTNGSIGGTTHDIVLNRDMTGGGNPLLTLNGTCTSCSPILQINGDANVIGLLKANSLYATNFIYYTSDRKLKRDIAPISGSLSQIMKLQPVSYVLKAGGNKTFGLIAQELEKVYPELVTKDPSGFKAVAYEGLIAPLIDAVQQLKKENDELSARLEELNKRQMQLEKQLETRPKN